MYMVYDPSSDHTQVPDRHEYGLYSLFKMLIQFVQEVLPGTKYHTNALLMTCIYILSIIIINIQHMI